MLIVLVRGDIQLNWGSDILRGIEELDVRGIFGEISEI